MYIIIVHSFVQNVMEKKGTSDMFSHWNTYDLV